MTQRNNSSSSNKVSGGGPQPPDALMVVLLRCGDRDDEGTLHRYIAEHAASWWPGHSDGSASAAGGQQVAVSVVRSRSLLADALMYPKDAPQPLSPPPPPPSSVPAAVVAAATTPAWAREDPFRLARNTPMSRVTMFGDMDCLFPFKSRGGGGNDDEEEDEERKRKADKEAASNGRRGQASTDGLQSLAASMTMRSTTAMKSNTAGGPHVVQVGNHSVLQPVHHPASLAGLNMNGGGEYFDITADGVEAVMPPLVPTVSTDGNVGGSITPTMLTLVNAAHRNRFLDSHEAHARVLQSIIGVCTTCSMRGAPSWFQRLLVSGRSAPAVDHGKSSGGAVINQRPEDVPAGRGLLLVLCVRTDFTERLLGRLLKQRVLRMPPSAGVERPVTENPSPSSSPGALPTWDDVVGLTAVKSTLQRTLQRLLRPCHGRGAGGLVATHRAADASRTHPPPSLRLVHGIAPAIGVVLYGVPGTGKTMLAKALASSFRSSFVYLSISALMHGEVGEAERKLHETFDDARRRSPSVIFLDEIQAVFAAGKGGDVRTSHDVRLITSLATNLDRCRLDAAKAHEISSITSHSSSETAAGGNKNDAVELPPLVLVLAATNVPQLIDPTLLLPGRFDVQLLVDPPSVDTIASYVRNTLVTAWGWNGATGTVGDALLRAVMARVQEGRGESSLSAAKTEENNVPTCWTLADVHSGLNIVGLRFVGAVAPLLESASSPTGGAAQELPLLQVVSNCPVPSIESGGGEAPAWLRKALCILDTTVTDPVRSILQPSATAQMVAAITSWSHHGGV